MPDKILFETKPLPVPFFVKKFINYNLFCLAVMIPFLLITSLYNKMPSVAFSVTFYIIILIYQMIPFFIKFKNNNYKFGDKYIYCNDIRFFRKSEFKIPCKDITCYSVYATFSDRWFNVKNVVVCTDFHGYRLIFHSIDNSDKRIEKFLDSKKIRRL